MKAVLLIPILIFSHIPLQRKDIKPFIFIFFLRVLTVSAGAAGYGFRIEAVLGDHTQVSTEGELYDFIQEDMARVQKVRFTSVAEAAIGLLVVSMPSLRVFLRRKGSKDVTVVVGITSNKGDIEASRISRGKYHSYVEMDAVLADHEVTKSTGQIVDPSSRSAGIK